MVAQYIQFRVGKELMMTCSVDVVVHALYQEELPPLLTNLLQVLLLFGILCCAGFYC
jgi:hypothetical protein